MSTSAIVIVKFAVDITVTRVSPY